MIKNNYIITKDNKLILNLFKGTWFDLSNCTPVVEWDYSNGIETTKFKILKSKKGAFLLEKNHFCDDGTIEKSYETITREVAIQLLIDNKTEIPNDFLPLLTVENEI